METWSQLSKILEFLKKWWKLIFGFFGSIFVILAFSRKDREWRENLGNAKQNLEGEIEAEKLAVEKIEISREKADDDFSEDLRSLKIEISEKKRALEKARESAKTESEKSGISKAIAELLDAELVEIKEE